MLTMKQLKVCVYTAMFAGYDRIIEHAPQTVDCDFMVFTDNVSAVPVGQLRGIIKHNPGDQISPTLKNLWLRMFPFDIQELNDYDILIYFDPNVRIRVPSFVEQIVRRYEETRDLDLMLSAHRWNICLKVRSRRIAVKAFPPTPVYIGTASSSTIARASDLGSVNSRRSIGMKLSHTTRRLTRTRKGK